MGKNTITITMKLDVDGNNLKQLSLDSSALKKALSSTVVESNKLKKSLINWSAAVQGLEAVSNAVGQLNSAFQGFIAESKDFSGAMADANTMAGKSGEDFDKLKDSVADLAKHVPVARDLLAKGLYQVVSNGVPENNWISFLESSARSSVGGLANLEKVVGVTSTVIKNYGLSWADAQAVQDKIQLTAKNGVTSFEQLAEALPRVTGAAANLGVGIDELMAVFATTTGVTGNTAEVSTQLAAVLSALTKPSSEAAKAAEEMGIQFDAAAVKSAGGLRNFLQLLDMSITEYAAKTGKLKETIYANLFGSAESLRLLTSLTGKQAQTFSDNIDNMVNSAGTMDEAYAKTASKGSAFQQMLSNQTAVIRDFAAKVMGSASPLLDFAASAGITATSIASLSKTLKYNTMVIKANNAITAIATSTVKLFSKAARTATVMSAGATKAVKVLSFSMKAIAPIAIIAGLSAIAAKLGEVDTKAKDAAESIEEIKEAEEEFIRVSGNARAELGKEISKLAELIRSHGDTTEAVQHLNEKYSESFGIHQTAKEWYDTLILKSKDYCDQLGYEAQAEILQTQLAQKRVALEINYAKRRELWDAGKAQRKDIQYHRMPGGDYTTTEKWVDTGAYAALKEEGREILQTIAPLESALGVVQGQMKELTDKVTATGNGAKDLNKELEISTMNLDQVSKAITETENALKSTTDPQKINSLKAYNAQLKQRKEYLEDITGLNPKKIDKIETQGINVGPEFTQFDTPPELNFNPQIKGINDLTIAYKKLDAESKSAYDTMKDGWGSVKGMSSGIQGITEALNGNGDAWQKTVSLVDGFISLYDGLMNVIKVIQVLTGVTKMQTAAEEEKSVAVVKAAATDSVATGVEVANSAAKATASGTEAAADATAATAKVMKAHSWIPFVGVAMGAAMAGVMIAMIAKAKNSVPKFADGGIVSGPTLGLMGEYSGAKSNPEVIAPLDKLRSLLNTDSGMGGNVRFRIEGRDLVAVLDKEQSVRHRR